MSYKRSLTGRIGGQRACLGRDGKYSVKNCNGSIWAQGIGRTQAVPVINEYDLFVPLGSDSLITSDGLTLKVIAE